MVSLVRLEHLVVFVAEVTFQYGQRNIAECDDLFLDRGFRDDVVVEGMQKEDDVELDPRDPWFVALGWRNFNLIVESPDQTYCQRGDVRKASREEIELVQFECSAIFLLVRIRKMCCDTDVVELGIGNVLQFCCMITFLSVEKVNMKGKRAKSMQHPRYCEDLCAR